MARTHRPNVDELVKLLPTVKPDQWNALELLLQSNRKRLLVHEIVAKLNVRRDMAHALILALGETRDAEPEFAIFHECDEDAAVEYRSLERGYLRAPWNCPGCHREYTSDRSIERSVRYDVVARLHKL